MANQLEDVDFARNPLHISHVQDAVLLEYFDCHFFFCKLVRAFPNLSKSAFTDLFFDPVVADYSALFNLRLGNDSANGIFR